MDHQAAGPNGQPYHVLMSGGGTWWVEPFNRAASLFLCQDLADFWRPEEHPAIGKAAKVEDFSAGLEDTSGPKGAKAPSSVEEAVPAEAAHPR